MPGERRGNSAHLPAKTSASDADDYYRELTSRNLGILDESTQSSLMCFSVLVAGCGSTGSAVVEPLVRLGVRRFSLADNGSFELNNLNRQHATRFDIGRNKAAVAEERILAVNPYADVQVTLEGITEDNAERLVADVDLVIDGVDVTEPAGWHGKMHLHRAAITCGKPVVSGYDMAGTQYVRYYDYRVSRSRPFDGKVTPAQLEMLSPWQLLARVIPVRVVPFETIRDLRSNMDKHDYHFPQIVYAAGLFGALVARMTAEIVSGGRPRTELVIDVHQAVRTRANRIRATGSHIAELAKAVSVLLRLLRRSGHPTNAQTTSRQDEKR